jgi:hypothetical protein
MSTLCVLLTGLTVALIVFTPLKYYIPGYGSANAGREFRQLKYRTDSLEKQVKYQARYIDNIKNLASGNTDVVLDTTQLVVPENEFSND